MQLADISFMAHKKASHAFTLAETMICLCISTLLFGGIILGYTTTCRRAEWTGYSLAAQSLAVQQLEISRASVWYMNISNQIEHPNLLGMVMTTNGSVVITTGYATNVLDIPVSGTNIVVATNFVTITPIALNSLVALDMVQVDTVWPFGAGKAVQLYTNTLAIYLAPDNRNPADFGGTNALAP